MPSLLELQEAFTAAMFQGRDEPVLAVVAAAGMAAEERLAVYRNNVFHNYREALRDVHPVVERLVGEDFFRFAAHRYIGQYRSTQGNLHAFGDRFAEFLAAFPPAAGLPYLADVARLEWLVHESFHAADRPRLATARLARVPSPAHGQLIFMLHPACRLLASQFPVHLIWEANQPGASAAVSLDGDDTRLLIRRRDYAVDIEAIGSAEFAMLQACAEGQPLARALARAQDAGRDFDLTDFLARRIGDGVLVDFAWPAP
jgi:hypothetical protein